MKRRTITILAPQRGQRHKADVCRTCSAATRGAAPSSGGAKCEQLGPPSVSQEAEVTDAHETLGQDRQKEAAQELGSGEGHHLLLGAMGVVFPAEGDALAIERHQTVIGNRHAVGVAAEIAQHLRRVPQGGLDVDHPMGAMQAREQTGELFGVSQQRSKSPAAQWLRLI